MSMRSVHFANILPTNLRMILVIDDDPALLALMQAILQSIGYAVYLSDNGEEALDILPELHPDAVIVNEGMPGVTGSEVCLAIKNDPNFASTPVILTSAGDTARSRSYLKQIGADAGLPKPYRRQDVADVLHSLNVPPSNPPH